MELYVIPSQKTYNGRTAGGYLKSARVCKMMAGTYEVVSDDLPGCLIDMTTDGDMVVTDTDGVVCRLTMSDRAAGKLRGLVNDADAKMR